MMRHVEKYGGLGLLDTPRLLFDGAAPADQST